MGGAAKAGPRAGERCTVAESRRPERVGLRANPLRLWLVVGNRLWGLAPRVVPKPVPTLWR